MKEIQVAITKYQSTDGTVHDTKESCIHQDKLLDGTRKSCDHCSGCKRIDPYGDGREYIKCPKCHGNGWLELRTEWK
jgi:LSD1 subclass zinc finger protein